MLTPTLFLHGKSQQRTTLLIYRNLFLFVSQSLAGHAHAFISDTCLSLLGGKERWRRRRVGGAGLMKKVAGRRGFFFAISTLVQASYQNVDLESFPALTLLLCGNFCQASNCSLSNQRHFSWLRFLPVLLSPCAEVLWLQTPFSSSAFFSFLITALCLFFQFGCLLSFKHNMMQGCKWSTDILEITFQFWIKPPSSCKIWFWQNSVSVKNNQSGNNNMLPIRLQYIKWPTFWFHSKVPAAKKTNKKKKNYI